MTNHQAKALLLSMLVVLSLGAAVTFTGSAAAELDQESQDAIDEANDAIEESNNRLTEELYPRLEANDPPTELEIDPIEADDEIEFQNEVERVKGDVEALRLGMVATVADEINDRVEEKLGDRPIDEEQIQTPEGAREQAEEFCDTYCSADDEAQVGYEGLMDMADAMEEMESRWDPQLATLEELAYADAATGTVTGTVVDENGDPVEGVDVSPASGPGSDTTGEDGTYEFETTTGDVTLEFSGDGYETTSQDVSVAENESTTAEETSMAAASTGGDGGEGGSDPLDSALSTGGLLLTVVGIAGMLGAVGYRAVRGDDAGPTLRSTAGTVGLLAVTGLAIGATGYLTINWAFETWSGNGIIEQVAPLIALLTVFLVAPALTVLVGIVESPRRTGGLDTALQALTFMGGAVLLVLLALALISQAGSGGERVATIDGVSVAGIVGTVSAIGYTVAVVAKGKVASAGSTGTVPSAD